MFSSGGTDRPPAWSRPDRGSLLRPAGGWRHITLIPVGFGAALRLNDTPSAPAAYVIVVATTRVAGTVLSILTTRLREHAATDQLTVLAAPGAGTPDPAR